MDRLDRGRFLEAALDLLCEAGWQELRISTLCARLGVTKGSFYWHFDDLEALQLAVLAAWEAMGTDDVIAAVEGTQRDPAERLRLLLRTAFAEPSRGDRIEAAIRAGAASDPRAAAVVARIDAHRLAYVRGLLEAAGVARPVAAQRSALVYRTLIGEQVWRSHGGSALGPKAIAELHRMLLGG